MQPKIAKRTRQFVNEVEAAGGSVQLSRDGHLKVFDVHGRFVVKLRRTGQHTGAKDERVKAQLLKRVANGTGGTS